MLQARTVSHREQQRIIKILANQANNAPFALGARGYLQNLLRQTDWPDNFKNQRIGGLTGVADFDAQELVQFASNQGTNPQNRRYTVLGDLLSVLLPKLGLEDQYQIVALISSHYLYQDEETLLALNRQYQVPFVSDVDQLAVEFGPDIDWKGPTEEVEYQYGKRQEPDYQDVGFIMRAIQCASSVCRVEIPEGRSQGTGFLVADNLVLTNFHVLEVKPDDLETSAHKTVLRFGTITQADGNETEGQRFKLVSNGAILAKSPENKLDYVLLRVEDKILDSEGLKPVSFSLDVPYVGMGINILQHPGGRPLQLALSGNGVDKVIEEKAYVQYSTRALGGSSGAPCFNDEWHVVALHHAQRSRSFGLIREGIIFQAIYKEIEGFLN